MTINAGKFAIAMGAAAALLWILCSLIVWIAPAMMMAMTGHMLHADFTHLPWVMSIGGVLAGLVLWTVSATSFGFLVAGVYNRLAAVKAD